MTVDDFNLFCRKLAQTTHVVQWGGAHVWKVAGKVFAIAWPDENDSKRGEVLVTFKCSDLSFELLKEMPGCQPAPYLASRGLTWIQRTGTDTMDDTSLADYLAESHRIVASGLSKRRQAELGLTPEALTATSGKSADAANKPPNKRAAKATTRPVFKSESRSSSKPTPRHPRGEIR